MVGVGATVVAEHRAGPDPGKRLETGDLVNVHPGLSEYPPAEGVGFEPTRPESGPTVFKTVALDHSATPPIV